MTTYTASYEPASPSVAPFVKFVLALLFVALAYPLATMAVERTIPPADAATRVIETDHATIAHGLEAIAIRACIAKSGVSQLWKTRSEKPGKANKFFRVCELPDGRMGMQIVQWSWRALAYREVTSFVVKDGRPAQLLEYLTAIAVQVR